MGMSGSGPRGPEFVRVPGSDFSSAASSSGRVSCVTGLIIGTGWAVLLPAGAIGAGAEPIALFARATVPWLLPRVLLAARAPTIGVKIDGSTLKVVSWWRTYRVDGHLVDEILIDQYSGYLNRWADGDVMGRHVKVLCVESGSRPLFSSDGDVELGARNGGTRHRASSAWCGRSR